MKSLSYHLIIGAAFLIGAQGAMGETSGRAACILEALSPAKALESEVRVRKVDFDEVNRWSNDELRQADGSLLDFSSRNGAESHVTEKQLLRTGQSIPRKDRRLFAKLIEQSRNPKLIRKAIDHVGGTERGMFRVQLDREIEALRRIHEVEFPNEPLSPLAEEGLGKVAALQVLARHSWSLSASELAPESGLTQEAIEFYRKTERIKVRPVALVNPGSEKIENGIEMGALRFWFRDRDPEVFVYTSSEFHSVGGTFELLGRIPNDRLNNLEKVEFFHNHPGSTPFPLSAADERVSSNVQKWLEEKSGAPVQFDFHAVQRINGLWVDFSSSLPRGR